MQFVKSISKAPEYLSMKVDDMGECDAYLAAYSEWLCLANSIKAPEWTLEPLRTALTPWLDPESKLSEANLKQKTPESFSKRNLYTTPKDPLKLRRPAQKVSKKKAQKKTVDRQKNVRDKRRDQWLAFKKSDPKGDSE